MNRLLILPIVAFVAMGTPALADSITGGTTNGPNSITGTTITADNSGTVTATGTFSGRNRIIGGRSNNIGVSAFGASVLVSIVREGGNPDVNGTTDTIAVGSISATNSGTVTATGTFSGVRLIGGDNNSATVSAAGTSVTIAITHR